MILLVKVLSIAMIIWGCFLILRPGTLTKVFEWVREGNNMYIGSAVKGVIGALLIIASNYCSIRWIGLFLGALMLFSGIAAFILKKEAILQVFDRVEKKGSKFAYMAGGVALLLGALLALAI